MKQLLTTIVGLTLGATAFGQAVSTSTIDDLRTSLQEQGLSGSASIITETLRKGTAEDTSINGSVTWFDLYMGKTIDENNSLGLLLEADMTNQSGATRSDGTDAQGQLRLDLVQADYTRGNILSEAKHGVTMNAQAKLGYFSNPHVRAGIKRDGFAQYRLNFTKALTDTISTSAYWRHDQYIQNSGAADVKNRRYRANLGTAYSATDKLTLAYSLMYENNIYNSSDVTRSESVEQKIASNYVLSPAINADLYMLTDILKSRDGKSGLAQDAFNKGSTFGFALNASLF